MNYDSLCLGCFADTGGLNPCSACGYIPDKNPEQSIFLVPGSILANKYLVGRVLGQGGFGITYLGWDLNLETKLAIKEYFPQGHASRFPGQSKVISLAGTEAEQFDFWLNRFVQESKTLAQFESHPNIVSVRDFFEANNTAYMIMNYIEGLTFEQYLNYCGGSIPLSTALDVAIPVLDALRAVHHIGFMHRDISPGNICIDNDGRVILIDFGASRQEMRENSKSLSVILKAGYAPIEQYQSRGRQGPWTDIYAVGATMYRAVTGQVPLDAIDRLSEDDLKPPSMLGVQIDPFQEQALLKAMAVKIEDRYQSVDDFIAGMGLNEVDQALEEDRFKFDDTFTILRSEELENDQNSDDLLDDMNPNQALSDEGYRSEKGKWPGLKKSNAKIKYAVASVAGFALLISGIALFGIGTESGPANKDVVSIVVDSTGAGQGVDFEMTAQTIDASKIAGLDADYYIDYAGGTIPLGNIPIGSRVVDPSWEWEYRIGADYSGTGQIKPVTWLVVAKNHYGSDSGVTLLSDELIGRVAYDNSTHLNENGNNHWGESGNHATATWGLRPWLNSTGIHSGEGFYQAFSVKFKQAVVVTTLPNNDGQTGAAYYTEDRVFIPSTTELGQTVHQRSYPIGTIFAYFAERDHVNRIASLGGSRLWYRTRTPVADRRQYVSNVSPDDGGFYVSHLNRNGELGVRPALNLKADTMVSEIIK